MDLEKLSENIRRTGFELEYHVSEKFREHGWSVINNKYYVDDISENVREIDLVAYKVKLVNEIYVYTSIIVSCKKNEENVWVLLAKDKDKNDPNIDWNPLHIWTNDKALSYMLDEGDWKEEYLEQKQLTSYSELFSTPKHQIFAFQEMNKNTCKPKNDRNIFDSITSLMKAQAYELTALPTRKKKSVVYQFNLLSVIDTDLISMKFDGRKILPSVVDEDTYVASYIIRKEQTFARIHIAKISVLSKILNKYDKLHDLNINYFSEKRDEFYVDAVKSYRKQDVFFETFKNNVHSAFIMACKRNKCKYVDIEKLWIDWDAENDTLKIMVGAHPQTVNLLDADEKLRERISTRLKDYYQYEGKFTIAVDDIPF